MLRCAALTAGRCRNEFWKRRRASATTAGSAKRPIASSSVARRFSTLSASPACASQPTRANGGCSRRRAYTRNSHGRDARRSAVEATSDCARSIQIERLVVGGQLRGSNRNCAIGTWPTVASASVSFSSPSWSARRKLRIALGKRCEGLRGVAAAKIAGLADIEQCRAAGARTSSALGAVSGDDQMGGLRRRRALARRPARATPARRLGARIVDAETAL